MPTLMLTTATLLSPVASATAYWKVSVPIEAGFGVVGIAAVAVVDELAVLGRLGDDHRQRVALGVEVVGQQLFRVDRDGCVDIGGEAVVVGHWRGIGQILGHGDVDERRVAVRRAVVGVVMNESVPVKLASGI